ncbi:flagellar basal body rod protein FlgC [Gilvimarinus agarilyticus]|uniref:flagellar basal body rod protein FlgC n=1 Tax=unclassified Gilvimarinus TaxID=2642066 RepID=UPI001C09F3EE|nr:MULTISPECIES: flagellar basal body rod protein FlgC [unclassified Gilvimarinus]MBU2887259.1 flagellar basal body rod protein FlgC [Gilvimarinus agarilyticus]MDO6571918.1 flagellar basal body rod protein FlgC [Gilvimarinus sp. 2_MG-2023]MDO6745987.1 flagellar basal body rod protein FlgC [Gilvimarinus sp. 1_MG-2023]
MGLNTIFDVAGSGMNAQSLRLNTTASNLANAQSASSSAGDVYRSRQPVFAAVAKDTLGTNRLEAIGGADRDASAGVTVLGVVESDAPYEQRYEPNHPLADEEGYVYYPNVNVVEEMTNMISASRSFQVNVEVMNAAKQMAQRVLTLGQ